jgi:hypothetical protein
VSFDASEWFWNISNGFQPQSSKLGPTAKMALQANSSNFFHPDSTNIDEKLYNDPIQIIPHHLGRLLVPVTPQCLGVTRGDNFSCPAMETVDRSFSTEVNSYIIKIIYVEDNRVLLGVFKHQHLYFCKRDLRTPARVNNVIMSAWIIVRSGTLGVDIRGVPFIGGFLISGG